ncbi:expressed unknown protein [Ectocarpus siliculosus]|uniref:Secreted protein n=1 Tax=Ectocarpus siliculosus TaxID=2880 RepID=D7FMJ1_ECTSI|nr:expressed unknown protein [Ectocarpus siliculosus]|eukprot:CBJ25888.1 expressed unknown protein [Ectocarpus siliculosus]
MALGLVVARWLLLRTGDGPSAPFGKELTRTCWKLMVATRGKRRELVGSCACSRMLSKHRHRYDDNSARMRLRAGGAVRKRTAEGISRGREAMAHVVQRHWT